MNEPNRIIRSFILLNTTSTLAASLIFSINTLFLLDAGLSNTQAFAINAAYTLGMVLFEVPTGVVADTWGRRRSYLLGATTLAVATMGYYLLWHFEGPLWLWVVVSGALGLGYTFFSGATEAWLVDALAHHGYQGNLESVFSKGQVASGISMLIGSIAGGTIAQVTDLGVPYLIRVGLLTITLGVGFKVMFDDGFTPKHGAHISTEMKSILKVSINRGLRTTSLRWIMLAAPFQMGAMIFAFYAMQPYLLELWGDPAAYSVAGFAAAAVSIAQIGGGLSVGLVRKRFKTRTAIIIGSTVIGTSCLLLIGLSSNFFVVVALLIVWSAAFSLSAPVLQAYVNNEIPSSERATILSFQSLMGSTGGVFSQPALGRVADMYSYSTSFIVTAGLQSLALPFLFFARRVKSDCDKISQQS